MQFRQLSLVLLFCITFLLGTQASKPKVALCFFGLVKNTTRANVDNYRSTIVAPLEKAGYAVEGFLHTYRLSKYGNRRNGEASSGLRTGESIEMWKTLVPFRSVEVSVPEVADRSFCPISRFFVHGDPWRDNPVVSMVYFLRQQFSLWRLTQTLARYKNEYVGAVYLRPDMKFLDELEMNVFQKLMRSTKRVIAAPTWHHWGGVNDRLAFGRIDEMIVYGERMQKLADYAQLAAPHAERYLRAYLNGSNIHVEGLSMRFQRVRTDGSVEKADESLAMMSFKYRKRRETITETLMSLLQP